MSVRLPLDENLSLRLLPLLLDRFPDSSHVRLLGLGGADDPVICLAIGNADNASTAALLLAHAEAIEAFSTHPEAGFLLLRPAGQAP